MNGVAAFIGLSYERMGLDRPVLQDSDGSKFIWNSLDIYDRLYGKEEIPVYIYIAIGGGLILAICLLVLLLKKKKNGKNS